MNLSDWKKDTLGIYIDAFSISERGNLNLCAIAIDVANRLNSKITNNIILNKDHGFVIRVYPPLMQHCSHLHFSTYETQEEALLVVNAMLEKLNKLKAFL